MNTPTVLVIGATGTVGSALVPELKGQGVNVRAMVRDPARAVPGVENVVADLRDPDALMTAMKDVHAVFLNSPSTEDAADLQKRVAFLAQNVGVSRLVPLSQYAARADSPVRFLRWHADVENYVSQLDLDVTVLRPNLYMQGLFAFAGTIAHGWFGAPIGAAAVSAIDTRDIAASAAAVLTGQGHGGRTYTLTGPRAVTHDEIAEAMAAATSREVVFRDVPPGEFAAALADAVPPWQLDGLVEDYAHYARGEAAEVHTSVTDLTGRPARDITEFARDHAAVFTPA
ncbi:NAD(P)H-binding protein [Spiractinospora alimapuensis]|uniref:NmrA family NAD(P)-binding protein n=1 Tax=Spiractinospora alimapuensis TaxID=2820884 RepID=UPI001F40CC2E|nr:NAD(P)H-binding protein [Spiractinospora alimapuensis]QVQ52318.1 NAD(P)H-binding protein [Spiractinospora alimapuensis]